MELLGTHKVSFDGIRSLAIQCHSLALSAYHLLLGSTHKDKEGRSKRIYEELFTAKLLALAIVIRTTFYQGSSSDTTSSYIIHSGFLYRYNGDDEKSDIFTIKDVCDKIIHAEEVSMFLEDGVPNPTTTLLGAYQKHKWELTFSVSLFCEGVLNWLQDLQKAEEEANTGLKRKSTNPETPTE
ncbi:MAG: hypothetical protein P4L43_17545 [Syntrophobacteraceae bacterium]|nr:hypothetical protein [Syntrophobacteraceae bacterium]